MGTPTRADGALPSVSVVVPTYQRRAVLDGVVTDLLERCAPAELVVVDDGSTDGSGELLARRAQDEPRLRPVTVENGGPMAARVAGARHASGEIVLMLDDDVRPQPGVVAGHARRHAAEDDLVLLGTMPVAPGPVDRMSYPRDLYGKAYEDAVALWSRDPEAILASFWTGHFSMPRAALLAVEDRLAGGPRHFHEDLDLGLILRDAGLHGAFDPELRAVHAYERAPDRYMVDGFRSGEGLAQTRRRHPEALDVLGDRSPAAAAPPRRGAGCRPRRTPPRGAARAR